MTQEEIENQKGIEQASKADVVKSEIKKDKKYLIDILGHSVVDKVYKDKVKYEKYCLKMMNIKAQGKIINYDLLSREKGLISLKVYQDDGLYEIINNFKINALHQNEAKLELDLSKPLEEQDPIIKLNLLTKKKRKNDDDLPDYFKSTKRTFSSFLVAKVEKRNLNPNKQMRLIEHPMQ
ncbi:hypothetical protein Tco_0661092 [Tanacetum coccineum]